MNCWHELCSNITKFVFKVGIKKLWNCVWQSKQSGKSRLNSGKFAFIHMNRNIIQDCRTRFCIDNAFCFLSDTFEISWTILIYMYFVKTPTMKCLINCLSLISLLQVWEGPRGMGTTEAQTIPWCCKWFIN